MRNEEQYGWSVDAMKGTQEELLFVEEQVVVSRCVQFRVLYSVVIVHILVEHAQC